jgi:capsular polysaccharide biosynthesis protein
MRDLHLGGNEIILYADLVSETARQTKVTHLQPQNLYAITCDSWNAQFAATFCNELTASLNDQPPGATSSQEPARTIDAALQPGTQVYPRWYLQGSIGLAVGCLIGLLWAVLRRPSKSIEEKDVGNPLSISAR